MSRYVMIADLRRCVGCQTCTAACKQARGTPVGVQWRRVLDIEVGSYPEVQRVFVPVGCQHCGDPPCVWVCPTGASQQRSDGVVIVDYKRCIGCMYCSIACPYDARFRTLKAEFAFGDAPTEAEAVVFDPERVAVATKCDFCIDRVSAGVEKGLVAGKEPDATPVCVNSCISGALIFGDLEDSRSDVSRLIKENQTFRMHEEVGTDPGFYYIWDGAPAPMGASDEGEHTHA